MKKIFLILFLINIIISAQDTLFFNADYIPYTDTTLLFIPSDYDSAKDYPLLFMLHGWSGNYNQWNEIAGLQKYSDDYQFIIVCPDGFYDSWYVNSPIDSTLHYETFFFKDLIPAVFNSCSIDYRNIFITGLSMGGHGAIYLFLKNPEFFRSAGSTSGILDLTEFPGKWGIEKSLGRFESYGENWLSSSSLYLLSNIKWSRRKIIVDCGTEDFAFDVNKKFADLCNIWEIDITFIQQAGKHSKEYWKESIKAHFDFFKELSRDSN